MKNHFEEYGKTKETLPLTLSRRGRGEINFNNTIFMEKRRTYETTEFAEKSPCPLWLYFGNTIHIIKG